MCFLHTNLELWIRYYLGPVQSTVKKHTSWLKISTQDKIIGDNGW